MKNDGVPKFADEGETEQRLAELERRLTAAEIELASWRNLQVAVESGGGGVSFGGNSVVLRINSLTNESAQMP
jgi:type 1 glutamine amidotransferase